MRHAARVITTIALLTAAGAARAAACVITTREVSARRSRLVCVRASVPGREYATWLLVIGCFVLRASHGLRRLL